VPTAGVVLRHLFELPQRAMVVLLVPVTKWSWIDFAVRQYQAPVSLSNGWGNDKGFLRDD